MKNRLTAVALGAFSLLNVHVLRAHHAFAAEFDDHKPVVLRGVVTKWELTNPHSWIHIDVKDASGNVVSWSVEGGSPNSLFRHGFRKTDLPPGTEIIVHGFQAKDSDNRAVGTDLTFTDGRRLFMGGAAPGADGPPETQNDK